MTNLYVITRVLTFFGALMRTFWEHLACRMCSVPVEDVRAFKSSELCGHVEHALVKNKKHIFLICWLPITLNFIFACCFLLSGAYRVIYIGDYKTISSWVFLWLGISFAANCVPSFEDVLSFKDVFYSKNSGLAGKIILAPFFGVIYGFALLERFSLTLVVSVLFAIVFPQIFNVIFPAITAVLQVIQ